MTSITATPEEVAEKYDPFEGETSVAENVSYEDFLRQYDGQHAEWFGGKVILVMANSLRYGEPSAQELIQLVEKMVE